MQRRGAIVTLLLVLGRKAMPSMRAADLTNSDLERGFAQTVRPFLTRYCIGCHSGDTPATQFDRRPYSTVAAVVRDYRHRTLALERLTAKEMPPKQAQQPSAAARQEVIDWVQAVRMNEARKNAGDPEPVLVLVLVRRPSNAEYNNTIRDLTKVDIRPTREFPVDPANPAGFDNSGESLLYKCLQAAREVGEIIWYSRPIDSTSRHIRCSSRQIARSTRSSGSWIYERQPTGYADYFQAAWRCKYRSVLGKSGATLAGIAAPPKLQAIWRALPAPIGSQPDLAHTECIVMGDFVVPIRKHTAMEFAAPVLNGLH